MKKLLFTTLATFSFLFFSVGFTNAQTWTPFTNLPVASWISVSMSPDGTKLVAACLNPSATFSSTNSGATWKTNNSIVAYSVSSLNGTKWLGSSGDLGLQISTNSGITWQHPNFGFPAYAVTCSADGNFLASGGFMWVTTNAGITSTYKNSPQRNGFAVFLNNGLTWLSLTPSGMYVSSDLGTTWTTNNVPSTNLFMLAASADGRKLIAPDQYLDPTYSQYAARPLYLSTNFGNSWFQANLPSNAWTSVACSFDGNKLIAVAGDAFVVPQPPKNKPYNISGGIFTSIDGGMNWTSNSISTNGWTSVASSADGSKLVAATIVGQLYKSFSPTPSPQLNLASSNTNLTFSWFVSSTNFTLQQSSDLTSTNWVTLTNQPTLNFSTLQNEISLTPSNNSGFFRLVTQ